MLCMLSTQLSASIIAGHCLSVGAHVRVVRGRTAGLARGLYDHHMLVTAVISASIVRVIHYTAPAAEGTLPES